MKRRLLQIVFVLGVLLTTMALIAFVRGLWFSDEFFVRTGDMPAFAEVSAGVMVTTNCRSLEVLWIHYDGPSPAPHAPPSQRWFHTVRSARAFHVIEGGRNPLWNRLGFGANVSRGNQWTLRAAAVPTWFVVLACASFTALPARLLRRARMRRQRAAHGLCVICGYDLRGANHERCPECGSVVLAHDRSVAPV